MGAPSVYMMKQWKKGGILSTNRGQGGTFLGFLVKKQGRGKHLKKWLMVNHPWHWLNTYARRMQLCNESAGGCHQRRATKRYREKRNECWKKRSWIDLSSVYPLFSMRRLLLIGWTGMIKLSTNPLGNHPSTRGSLGMSDKVTDVFRSPPARWGLLDFIRAVLLLLRLLLHLLLVLLLAVQIPVGTAGPPPRAPDPSGHCRTSTASSRSQWALPDLHRELQIAVGTAGPQPRLPGCSGHCRTSTAISKSQWALPDLNRDFQVAVGTAGPQPRAPDPSGHCRTSTAR